MLGIKELRPGGEQDANWDESKANIYPNLPDPLVEKNGKRVTTADEWWTERRPEIVADYDREVLGQTPANLPKVNWEVVTTTKEMFGDTPVVTKRLAGHVDNSSYPQITVTIDATLIEPASSAAHIPVIMELAFGGEYKASLHRPLSDTSSGALGDYGQAWERQVLARGWAVAVLSPTSFQADDGAGLTEGIIGLMNKGQPRGLHDWGALKAWAWGASRFLDYLETDPAVDAKQVAIEGHSRLGKTALVAMAYDPRFAVVYSSSSGEGGAKLYRHIYGEPLSHLMNAQLYQWMSPQMLKYAGPLTPADLPVDNHELIALCAPRPVFIGAGALAGSDPAKQQMDGWADARGMFLAEVAAGPVYRLLGKKDLGTTQFRPSRPRSSTATSASVNTPAATPPPPTGPHSSTLQATMYMFPTQAGQAIELPAPLKHVLVRILTSEQPPARLARMRWQPCKASLKLRCSSWELPCTHITRQTCNSEQTGDCYCPRRVDRSLSPATTIC